MLKTEPLVRKGRRKTVDVYIVAWVDLLGYGNQIQKANLNPVDPAAVAARERLVQFSECIRQHSARLFPSLIVNDAAIFFRNLSFRSRSNTFDFFNRCQRLHRHLKRIDEIGARTVISVGFRDKRTARGMEDLRRVAEDLSEQVSCRAKTVRQAITQALLMKASFNRVPALNSNYALTKSYSVDSLGAHGGFGGPELYVESGIFSDNTYPIGEFKSIECNLFGRTYRYFRPTTFGIQPDHIAETIEIAEYLAGDPSIFERIFEWPRDR